MASRGGRSMCVVDGACGALKCIDQLAEAAEQRARRARARGIRIGVARPCCCGGGLGSGAA